MSTLDLSASLIKSTLWHYFVNSEYSGVQSEIYLPGRNDRADMLCLNYNTRIVALFEIKRTKADFKRGFEKYDSYFSKSNLCYIVTPSGLVSVEDVPEGWGLIELGESIKDIVYVKEATLHTIPAPFFDFYAKEILEKYKSQSINLPLLERTYAKQVKYGPS